MNREVLEGYIVDIACLRKYPHSQVAQRAVDHSRDCVLMGHCIESGYGLVDNDGQILLLDTQATRAVIESVSRAIQSRGIRIRVRREMENGEMLTRSVELAE